MAAQLVERYNSAKDLNSLKMEFPRGNFSGVLVRLQQGFKGLGKNHKTVAKIYWTPSTKIYCMWSTCKHIGFFSQISHAIPKM